MIRGFKPAFVIYDFKNCMVSCSCHTWLWNLCTLTTRMIEVQEKSRCFLFQRKIPHFPWLVNKIFHVLWFYDFTTRGHVFLFFFLIWLFNCIISIKKQHEIRVVVVQEVLCRSSWTLGCKVHWIPNLWKTSEYRFQFKTTSKRLWQLLSS